MKDALPIVCQGQPIARKNARDALDAQVHLRPRDRNARGGWNKDVLLDAQSQLLRGKYEKRNREAWIPCVFTADLLAQPSRVSRPCQRCNKAAAIEIHSHSCRQKRASGSHLSYLSHLRSAHKDNAFEIESALGRLVCSGTDLYMIHGDRGRLRHSLEGSRKK